MKQEQIAPITSHPIVRKIITALKEDKRRDVYEAGAGRRLERGSGEYFISYQGGGPFSRTIIFAMFDAGLLTRKYPHCECYELSKTA